MSVYKRTVRGKRARRYSIDYVDEGGVNRTVSSGTSDKRLAEQIKRKLVDRARAVQAGLVDPSEARLRSEADRPLAQHVNEYVEALVPLDGLSPKQTTISSRGESGSCRRHGRPRTGF